MAACDGIELVRSIYRTNKAHDKKEPLGNFWIILKPEVRLCVDLRILPVKKKAALFLLMGGKQVVSWRNASW